MLFFFFNDTATTEIYTLSLHDALPIYAAIDGKSSVEEIGRSTGLGEFETTKQLFALVQARHVAIHPPRASGGPAALDRKSTRLNSSHANISYAVFCLKKKKTIHTHNSD